MANLFIILFGLIGCTDILFIEKEMKFRQQKELLKANQIMKIIKISIFVEIILFGLFILYE